MLPLVAERSLRELAVVRGLLNGDIDPATMPDVDKNKPDGANRRAIALKIVDGLGRMFAHVLQVSHGSEEEIFHACGGMDLVKEKMGEIGTNLPQPPEEEKRQFGFAQWAKSQ